MIYIYKTEGTTDFSVLSVCWASISWGYPMT